MSVKEGWKYNQKAKDAKALGNTVLEIRFLKKAVEKGVNTKYSYNRLAVLLRKRGKLKEAIKVQKKHFLVMADIIANSPKGSWLKKNSDKVLRPIIDELKKMKSKLQRLSKK